MWTKNATFLQANNFEDIICKPGPVCAKTINAKFMLQGQFDGICRKIFDNGEYSWRRGCPGRHPHTHHRPAWARWICVCLQQGRTFIACPGEICNSCSYCYNNAITSMQIFLREKQWTLTCWNQPFIVFLNHEILGPKIYPLVGPFTSTDEL